jgi:hypothetical protein
MSSVGVAEIVAELYRLRDELGLAEASATVRASDGHLVTVRVSLHRTTLERDTGEAMVVDFEGRPT